MNTKNAFDYLTGKLKFDPEQGAALSKRGAEEGIVLLENKNKALPLSFDENIAVFGRMQKHYLILGTGSGGRVDPPYITNIFDSLSSLGAKLDKEVESYYDAFVASHPYEGTGGWNHPASQIEPALDTEFVASAAQRNDTALFIVTRTAGEDGDMPSGRGGFSLTGTEIANLKLIRNSFKKVVVLLNVAGVIEMYDILETNPDAILMLWTGGMMGGIAAANVIMGKVNPSGKLPDTIALYRTDYPSHRDFGEFYRNFYKEDIYVGYRYFNTFAPEKIVYPFGFGLSYTEFSISFLDFHRNEGKSTVQAVVSNEGDVAGREVVQCYVSAPNGKLGKPAKVLAAFAKTPMLAPGESCTVSLSFDDYTVASYDDSGVTGHKSSWILEAGEYVIYVGNSVSHSVNVGSFNISEDTVLKTWESAVAPVQAFNRLVNKNGLPAYEPAPLKVEQEEPIPAEIPQVEKDGLTLDDVADGKITVEDLVARMSDKDLIHIVRAEGMASPKGSPGNAAVFVGTTPSLKALGLPVCSCIDGPSGIRSVNNEKRICYPAATCLAATWDLELMTEMYTLCGNELASNGIDILLGPSTNIHRDPLCGRNFEYFSEDPLLSGKMAAAISRGLSDAGVSGAVKHFMANNQEHNRHGVDSILSERAVREIYTKPFEICVQESDIRSVMTSYNPVNGRWAASNYDLTVRILRNDFGFDGFVMTDWWARVNQFDDHKVVGCTTNLRGMVHALNDVYMVSPDAVTREDNLEESLANGSLTRGELQACAANLIRFALISLNYMAQRSGYGVRDLKAECEGKTAEIIGDVIDGKVTIESPLTRVAIMRASFISDTPVLTQTSVSVNINTKNATAFVVGGTEGKIFQDYREVGILAGKNEIIFNAEDPLARAVKIEIF